MRTYILKYKYENLVHILLLALNAAIFVSASVTLAGIEANPIFFGLIRSGGRTLRYLFSFELYYHSSSSEIDSEDVFGDSAVLS